MVSEEELEATALIRRGFSPVPLIKFEKRPNCKFSIDYPKTETDIPNFFWDDGVGIHLGRSNVWVLDIDGPVGYKNLKELTDTYGELPETRTVKSGRLDGGVQYYWDATDLDIHSGVLRPNIDIKGNHGNALVVVPPTLHKSGNRYSYLLYIPPVAAPDWLVDEILKLQNKTPHAPIPSTINSFIPSITEDYGLDCMVIGAPTNPKTSANGYQGGHPFHGSETGTNFAIDVSRNIWYCFRHHTAGDAADLMAVKHGLILCEDVKSGCLKPIMDKVIDAIENEGYKSKTKDAINSAVASILLGDK
jgi:hypothetical protein